MQCCGGVFVQLESGAVACSYQHAACSCQWLRGLYNALPVGCSCCGCSLPPNWVETHKAPSMACLGLLLPPDSFSAFASSVEFADVLRYSVEVAVSGQSCLRVAGRSQHCLKPDCMTMWRSASLAVTLRTTWVSCAITQLLNANTAQL